MATAKPVVIDVNRLIAQDRKWSICPRGGLATSKRFEFGHVLLHEPAPTDKPHYHRRTEEYYLILQGWMVIQIGSTTLRVKPRQLLMVPPGKENVHIIKAVDPSGTLLLLFKAPSVPGDKVDHPLPS